MGAIRVPPRDLDHVDERMPDAPDWLRDVARRALARLGLKQSPTAPAPIIGRPK